MLDSGAEGLDSNRSRDAAGNSLRQTVHIHCASVHQAAKLVAALLRVAGVTAGLKVMAAYRPVYDSRHLQADCQEPGSAAEPYARQSSMGCLYPFLHTCCAIGSRKKIPFSAEQQTVCRLSSPYPTTNWSLYSAVRVTQPRPRNGNICCNAGLSSAKTGSTALAR